MSRKVLGIIIIEMPLITYRVGITFTLINLLTFNNPNSESGRLLH